MKGILYLTHRIPYPPNKGDKIRSFHWLKHLAGRRPLYLGTFVDDPDDWRHEDAVRDYCADACLRPRHPFRSRMAAVRGLAGGQPLTLACYRDRVLERWAAGLVAAGRIDTVLVFSSAMAQFVDPAWPVRKVIDFVDVDSDKWRQYAGRKPFWSAWIYRREAERLLEYDRRIAAAFDRSLFVSEAEADLFRRLAPEAADRVDWIENGVDTDYFRGGREFANPYHPGEAALVFTGAMDYWANVDAVRWFADRVFPRILQHHVEARFYIVGARPLESVRLLGRREGIVVTGAVADVRPYLAHARLAVAPLRIARGIQNKVLEALAMAKPVLATTMAMDGLALEAGLAVARADDAEAMAEIAVQALRDRDFLPCHAPQNRRFVEGRYSWRERFERLDRVLGIDS